MNQNWGNLKSLFITDEHSKQLYIVSLFSVSSLKLAVRLVLLDLEVWLVLLDLDHQLVDVDELGGGGRLGQRGNTQHATEPENYG